MGLAVAPALVAALLRTASLDVDLGLRAESRSSALSQSDRGRVSRTSVSAIPSAAAVGRAGPLLLETRYAPRLWTSDVAEETSPLVSHTLEARLARYGEGTWRAQVAASGFSGETDPLADPWRVAASDAPWQLATAEPLRYEELRTAARAEVMLDPRTTVAAGGAFQVSRASEAGFRDLLPTQRGGSVNVALTRLVTERDTLRVDATGRRALTDLPAGRTRIGASGATATWRRRASPRTEVWLSAGASLLVPDPRSGARREVVPAGEAGLARSGEGSDASLELRARATTYVDRFTGDAASFAEGVCTLRWALGPRLLLSVSASGGGRTDGDAILAGGDTRLAWTLRDHLAIEVGASGRLQEERRAGLPSVRQGAVVVALAWAIQPLSLGRGR